MSDLFTLEGISSNVPKVLLTDNGAVQAVEQAEDPGDITIVGGQAFILNAQEAATVSISGGGILLNQTDNKAKM